MKINISLATVSRGLKDDKIVSKKTGKKIFGLAEEMGYRSNHFARNLRPQRTNTIGIIVPKLNSHFITPVLGGIEKVPTEGGFGLIITPQSSESYLTETANSANLFDSLIVPLATDTTDPDHNRN